VTYLRQSRPRPAGSGPCERRWPRSKRRWRRSAHLPETPRLKDKTSMSRLDFVSSLYPLGEFDRMLVFLQEAETIATGNLRFPSARADSSSIRRILPPDRSVRRSASGGREGTGSWGRNSGMSRSGFMPRKISDSPVTLSATTGAAADLMRTVARSPESEMAGGRVPRHGPADLEGVYSGQPRVARALPRRGGEVRGRIAAGRQADCRCRRSRQPVRAGRIVYSGWGTVPSSGGSRHCRLRARAGPDRRARANLALYRPQATRLLGGVYLLAGRIDEA
jgi:hypothetical protein